MAAMSIRPRGTLTVKLMEMHRTMSSMPVKKMASQKQGKRSRNLAKLVAGASAQAKPTPVA